MQILFSLSADTIFRRLLPSLTTADPGVRHGGGPSRAARLPPAVTRKSSRGEPGLRNLDVAESALTGALLPAVEIRGGRRPSSGRDDVEVRLRVVEQAEQADEVGGAAVDLELVRERDLAERDRAGRDADGSSLTAMTTYSRTVVDRVAATRRPLVVTGTDDGEVVVSESVEAHDRASLEEKKSKVAAGQPAAPDESATPAQAGAQGQGQGRVAAMALVAPASTAAAATPVVTAGVSPDRNSFTP